MVHTTAISKEIFYKKGNGWQGQREREREHSACVACVVEMHRRKERERERGDGKQLVFYFKIPFKVAGVSMTFFKNVKSINGVRPCFRNRNRCNIK